MLIGTRANLRIESSEPSIASGGTTALTRLPSARRASTIGDDSSTRRPTAETIFWMIRSRCFSSLKRTGVGSSTPIALDEHLVVAVDQDVGDRRVLEQRLERAEAEQLVEHVADQLLALGMVERVVLLGQLLGDDVADFVLDLLARHLVERRQVDQVEQPLVKLDLEVGVLVALGEGAGIADASPARWSSHGRSALSLGRHLVACGLRTCHMI